MGLVGVVGVVGPVGEVETVGDGVHEKDLEYVGVKHVAFDHVGDVEHVGRVELIFH